VHLILSVGEKGHEATLANALTSAVHFGLERQDAMTLLEDLRARVNVMWKSAFGEAGIGAVVIERFANCFAEAANDKWQDGER
jgi:hypothetical protein